MPNFDMDFDKAVRKESRLARQQQLQKQKALQKTEQERQQKHRQHVDNKKRKPVPKKQGGGGDNKAVPPTPKATQPEKRELEHTHERSDVRDERATVIRSSSSSSTTGTSDSLSMVSNTEVNRNQFKEIPNLFTYVGGSQHVVMEDDYKKVQVTGLPEPLIRYHQNKLKEQLTGRLITFPWGDYEITPSNKVFTARTSYMRYNLFHSLRDTDATHVILAKQWLVSHHTMIYSEHYDLAMSYQVHNDELDIYAVIYAQYLDELKHYGVEPKVQNTEADSNISEMMDTLYIGLSSLRKLLQEHQEQIKGHTEQTNMIQTVLLLDRLGLLGGGLPSDMKDFTRVLELNRDKIHQANASMSNHIKAEKERLERLKRDRRLRNK